MKRSIAVIAVLLAVGCAPGTVLNTASPTASLPSTPSPAATTAGVTAIPTAPPTLATTATPGVTPAAQATASPVATATDVFAGATAAQALLVGLVEPSLRSTCHARDHVYDLEVDSISCGPEDLPFDYSLFGTIGALRDSFQHDVDQAETKPVEDGSCDEGNYLAIYKRDANPVGRVNCRSHTSSSTGALFHVIEWTHEATLVIGYISNRVDAHTWDELIDFWETRAGPFPSR
jgi:hypothetical protein